MSAGTAVSAERGCGHSSSPSAPGGREAVLSPLRVVAAESRPSLWDRPGPGLGGLRGLQAALCSLSAALGPGSVRGWELKMVGGMGHDGAKIRGRSGLRRGQDQGNMMGQGILKRQGLTSLS